MELPRKKLKIQDTAPAFPGKVALLFVSALVLGSAAAAAQRPVDARYNLALKNYRDNDFGDANWMVRRILEQSPDCAPCLYLYGLTFASLHRYSAAEDQFRKIVEIDPSNRRARLDLGIALLQQGKTEQAAQAFQQALKRNPDDLTLRLYLGRVEMDRGNDDEALGHFQAIVERDPRFPSAHALLARIHLEKGDQERAVLELRRETSFYPHDPQAQMRLAELLLERHEAADALQALLMARPYALGDAALHRLLARTYRALGRVGQAVQSALRSLQIRPEAETHLLLAELYRQSGDSRKAEEQMSLYEKALGKQ